MPNRRQNPSQGVGAPASGFLVSPSKVTQPMKTRFRQSRSAAFTLVEIMVVLVVIGILAGAILPQFLGTTKDAKISAAKANVAELESALERFYVNMDRYPTTEEGLKVLLEAPAGEEKNWRGPYVKLLRPDPWGNSYQYRAPGVHHTSSFDVWSQGSPEAKDGQPAEIGNW
jgi:general secretion pathway protein G